MTPPGTTDGMHTIGTVIVDTVITLIVYGIGAAVIATVLNRGVVEA